MGEMQIKIFLLIDKLKILYNYESMLPPQKADFNEEILSFVPEFIEKDDIAQIKNFSLSLSNNTKSSYIRKILSKNFPES
jgi:hypothetical protein